MDKCIYLFYRITVLINDWINAENYLDETLMNWIG